MLRILAFTFLLVSLFSCRTVFAQTGSSGTRACATVVEPISITKSVDLDFESVAIIIAGSVELVPTDFNAASADIVLPVTTGTFTAASFVLAGTTAYSYKISVPPAPVEVEKGKQTLTVRSFDSDPILNKDSDMLAGVFVSVSPMNVTVNYN